VILRELSFRCSWPSALTPSHPGTGPRPSAAPGAVLLQEDSDLGSSILKALETPPISSSPAEVHSVDEFGQSPLVGHGPFRRRNLQGFDARGAAGRRSSGAPGGGRRHDPVAASSALSALRRRHPDRAEQTCSPAIRPRRLSRSGAHLRATTPRARAAQHRPRPGRHHPDHDMLIFTALSVTREVERGTMENLLSMRSSRSRLMSQIVLRAGPASSRRR